MRLTWDVVGQPLGAVGIELFWPENGSGFFVRSLVEGGPAEECAGIECGEMLRSIDGVNLLDCPSRVGELVGPVPPSFHATAEPISFSGPHALHLGIFIPASGADCDPEQLCGPAGSTICLGLARFPNDGLDALPTVPNLGPPPFAASSLNLV